MTMDLYGHLNDQNLWDAAKRVTKHTGGLEPDWGRKYKPPWSESGL
jgi:hypothetical protein